MDGRKAQVVLLDERKIELVVQSRMVTQDLLHIVCNYFSLTEKAYFGLSFQDDSGHYFFLQNDCKVLDHEYPAKHRTGVLILYFLVKLYPEHISHLQDSVTYELFFLQTRSLIFRGFINVDSDVAYKLAALALQASYGDYYDDDLSKENLKKLPVLPSSVFREHPTLSYSEERVIAEHKKLIGLLRGQCIIEYLQISQTLPTYGVHFYQVKDNKTNAQATLGLSAAGVSQYAVSNHVAGGKKTRVKFFGWKQLENLYYREKKFSIEVRDPRRIMQTVSSFNLQDENDAAALDRNELPGMLNRPMTGGEADDALLNDAITDPTTHVSLSRRTYGPTSVTVHSWFTSHPLLTKNLWQMAIIQHQFFLECKHRRQQLLHSSNNQQAQNNIIHQDLTKIAARLNTMQTGALPSIPSVAGSSSATKNRLSHSSFFRSNSSNLKPSTSHTSLNTSINSNVSGSAQQQQPVQMINRSYSTTTSRRRSAVLEGEMLSKQQQQQNVDTISVNSSPLLLHRRSAAHAMSSKDQLDGSSNNDSNLLLATTPFGGADLNSSHSTGHETVDGSFRERIEILSIRRMALDDALSAKMAALKALCIREAELTGVLPAETPLEPGVALPAFKKRMGTAFNLSGSKLERFLSSSNAPLSGKKGVDTVDSNNSSPSMNAAISSTRNDADDAVEKLFAELEIRQDVQRQIVHAVQVLAEDATVTSKKIRKQRKQTLSAEQQKLVEIDKQLIELKKAASGDHQQQLANGVVWPNQNVSSSSQQAQSGRVAGRRLFSQLHRHQQQQQSANIRTAGAQPLIVSRLAVGSSSCINTPLSADLESVRAAKPAGSSVFRHNSLQKPSASIYPGLTSAASCRAVPVTSSKAAAEPDVQSIGCTSSIVESSSSSSSSSAPSLAAGSLQSLNTMPNSITQQQRSTSGGSAMRNNLLVRRASKLSVDSSGTNSLLMPPPPSPPPPSIGRKTTNANNVISTEQNEHDAAYALRKSQSQGALHTIAAAPTTNKQHADGMTRATRGVVKQLSAQTLPTAQAATLAEMSVSGGNIATASGGGSVGRGCAENDSGFVADASCCSGSATHAATHTQPFHGTNDYDEINEESLPSNNEVDADDASLGSSSRQHVYNVQQTRSHHHMRHLSKVSELADAEQQPPSTEVVQSNSESRRQHHHAIYDVEELNRSKYDNVDTIPADGDDADKPGVFVRSNAGRPGDGALYEQTRASMRVLSSSSTISTGNAPTTPTSTTTTAPSSTATQQTTRAMPVDVVNDDCAVIEEESGAGNRLVEPSSIKYLTSNSRDIAASSTASADELVRRRLNSFNKSVGMAFPSPSRISNPALSASAHKRRPLALRSDAVSCLDADTAATILNAMGMAASPTRHQNSNADCSTYTLPNGSTAAAATGGDAESCNNQNWFAVPQIPSSVSSNTRRESGSFAAQQQRYGLQRSDIRGAASYQMPNAAAPARGTGNNNSESRWYYNHHQQQQQHPASSMLQQNSSKARNYQAVGSHSAATSTSYQVRAVGLPPHATYQFGDQRHNNNLNFNWRTAAPPPPQPQKAVQYAFGESIKNESIKLPSSYRSAANYPQRFASTAAAEQQQPRPKIVPCTTPFSPLPPQPSHNNQSAAVVASGAASKTDVLNKTMRAPPPPSPVRKESVRFPSGTATNSSKTGVTAGNSASTTPAMDNSAMPSSSPQPPPLPSKRERCRSNSSSNNNTLIRAVGSTGVCLPTATRTNKMPPTQQGNSRATRPVGAWNSSNEALAGDDKYIRQALV